MAEPPRRKPRDGPRDSDEESVGRLPDAEARLSELADHIAAVFWLSSSDNRRVIYASPAMERIFGRSRESLYANPRLLLESIHPDDREEVMRASREGPEGSEAEYRVVRPDGTIRWLHGRAYPIRDEQGNVVRLAGISQDVTEWKRTELELRGRNRVLEQLASGDPLESVLATLVEITEEANPELRCAFLLRDGGGALVPTAAPNLPDALARRIASHPDRDGHREVAERVDLHGFVSQPIRASSGDVLGRFDVWLRDAREPSERESDSISAATRLAAVAIEGRRSEAALRRSRAGLEEAQRIAHVGSWEWDIPHDAVAWSDEMFRIMGAEPRAFEVTLESFLDHVHPDDVEIIRSAIRDTLENDAPYHIETRMLWPDGSVRYVNARAELERAADGSPRRLIGTAQDITERRLAEQERRGLEIQIRHSQQLESLGVLAGGIAHDFNNLLSVIIGNSGLALDDLEPGSPASGKLRRVRDTAKYAADLVDQILTYSGKPSIDLRPVDLTQLVENMLLLIETSVAEKCELVKQLVRGLPSLQGDPTQIRQIVLNLVTNASEAVGDAGGCVVVRTGLMQADASYLAHTVGASRTPPGEYVYLEVSDDGTGMDAATQARLFDPFFSTKFSGRGLGLAAVLGIVRGHGGAIELESEPGAGTRFRVLLPRADASQPEQGTVAKRGERASRSGTILAVDDEEWVLDIAREFLERAGYRVITARGGRESIELFNAHADEIDAVVLDLAMPDVDGPEAFESMRRVRPDVPVILVSGYNQELAARRLATAKATGFVRKPYEPEDLVGQVRAALAAVADAASD